MKLRSISIRNNRTGLTLIEVMISIAIVTLLGGFGLWISMDAYRAYSYRSEEHLLISVLQKARLESMVNINAAPHGVYVEPNKLTIFQGISFATRNSAFDQVISPANAVTYTGNPALPQDVIFGQLSGTSTVRTITVSDAARSSTISLNNEGQISW